MVKRSELQGRRGWKRTGSPWVRPGLWRVEISQAGREALL